MMLLKFRSSVPFRIVRRCSQATSTPNSVKLPESFRTLETDPRNLTLDHEGKFYTIDPQTCETLFKYGGFTGHYLDQLKIINETALMVRKPALEVIHYLKNADYSLPPIRYVLYSLNLGSGMTLSLAHVIHWAWMNKWMIVHCPRPFSWVRSSKNEDMTLSAHNPVRLDQNRDATKWLKQFKLQNLHLLDQIKLSKSYTWSKREISAQGDTLTSVVDHGLDRTVHATDCVGVLLKEIKSQSGPNSFRTLVIIDGVNSLFGEVIFRKPGGKLMDLNDMSLLRAFKKLLSNDWSNAAIVTSADRFAHSLLPKRKEKPAKVLWPDRNPYVYTQLDRYKPIVRREMCYPRELLGPEGFSKLDPFVPIEVEKYSLKEFNSCFDYYLDIKYIQSEEGRSEEGRQELRFLTGLIPGDLMRFCACL